MGITSFTLAGSGELRTSQPFADCACTVSWPPWSRQLDLARTPISRMALAGTSSRSAGGVPWYSLYVAPV